jgi:surface protein
MFNECIYFNSDLSKWDVSNGITFNYMFSYCKIFNSDLSEWDVSNGESFEGMFVGCKSFDADLSGWNVSRARFWKFFAEKSLLEKYHKRIPEKFIKSPPSTMFF